MELVRINELDSNYINKIFDEIKTKINLDWFNDSLIAAMKIEYYYNHAFTKYISLLFYNLINIPKTMDEVADSLASVIVNKFKTKWTRLHEVLNLTYNPIDNYNMSETEKTQLKSEANVSNANSIYAFNDTKATPTNESNSKTSTNALLNDNVRELTRKGNIGVTTSQQMINSEIELREYNLIEAIYSDIDSILTLKIY